MQHAGMDYAWCYFFDLVKEIPWELKKVHILQMLS